MNCNHNENSDSLLRITEVGEGGGGGGGGELHESGRQKLKLG